MLSNVRHYLSFSCILLLSVLNSCRISRVYNSEFVKPENDKFFSLLPSEVNETSGLIFFNGRLWTLNDSGGEPVLYSFSVLAPEKVTAVNIPGIENIDWEELTQDENHIYIGDFGNNFGGRDTLSVFMVDKKEVLDNKVINVAEISFTYLDKSPEFHRCKPNPFDCEAMIVHNDSLLLFTKNWQDETSQIYKLPLIPGHYNLRVNSTIHPNALITGAVKDKDHNIIWLVGYHHYVPSLFAYQLNSEPELLYKARLLNRYGLQTEAITLDDKGNLWVSYEKSRRKQGLLKLAPAGY